MSTNTAVDNAIKLAQAKAAETQETKNLPAETAQTGTAVGQPMQAMPRSFSSSDMSVGMMSVDAYLQVANTGMSVKGKQGVIYEAEVLIDFNKVSYNETIKYGQNPVTYKKTYDGVMTTDGIAWAKACEDARRVDPKAAPYKSADLPMTVLKDLVVTLGAGKTETVAAAGDILGHSLSTTNRANFAALVADMKAKGLSADHQNGIGGSRVIVKLTHEPKEKGTNKWGLLKFELIGDADEGEGEGEQA